MNTFDRIPRTPPPVARLEEASKTRRPLWSVMIPAYNCARYLPQTLESVLCQWPGADKMQIEVCDDASTDADLEQLVQHIGQGRVSYYRQPFNVGSLRNFETCLNRSRGTLVHLLHGDDRVMTGFYEKMEKLFARFPEAGAAFCRYRTLDQYNGDCMISDLEMPQAGLLDNWLERLACKQLIQTPAMVVRRTVYEELGGFYGVHYGEDWEMWLRISARYPVGYLPDALAEYRKHSNSISGQYILTGQNIRDLKKVMQIAREYFSEQQWRAIHKKEKEFYARYAIHTARKIWGRNGHGKGTRAQIREAVKLGCDRHIIFESAKLYAKMLLGIRP